MKKNSINDKGKISTRAKNKTLKRITIRISYKNYKKLLDLKNHSHARSFAQVADILLTDELSHPTPLNNKRLNNLKKDVDTTNWLVGKFLNDISYGFVNLNQITQDVNSWSKSSNKQDIIQDNKDLRNLTNQLKTNQEILNHYLSTSEEVRKCMLLLWQSAESL